MSNQIIIIAEVYTDCSKQGGKILKICGINRVTEIFETGYLTEAHKMLTDKYEGYEIEILYIFDSVMNEKKRFDYILNKEKNEKEYPTIFYKCNCILCNELHTGTKV